MSLFTLKRYIEEFYQKHHLFLQKNYPGLTLNRLFQEIEHIDGNYYAFKQEEILSAVYLPHKKNPYTLFFEKILAGVPLEYITGKSYFYSSEFFVNSHVLIPRKETEHLVHLVLEKIKNKPSFMLADIGTGSGVIGVTLMCEIKQKIKMVMTDLSLEALQVAKTNFESHRFLVHPESEAVFLQRDRLEHNNDFFDMIISNPPYLDLTQKEEVHPQVSLFEPAEALFIKEDYLYWYETFFTQIKDHLKEEGSFLIEGDPKWLPKLQELAQKIGFKKVEIRKDLAGRLRYLEGEKNG
ncbi:MAG: peptide chain release factor N(5)-glutamine methyltransferase [Bacteriovoracaceae bacterium]|nr:peptide chain release factor N(5)-glutamine methyltransferase [Bacteriovoracaceae bacterium]